MAEHAFQTEVQQLLHLMIHSLYSEREIFLRELISNASDACDKLRFQALTEHGLLKGDEDLRIAVRYDGEAKTLSVEDNGIGLSEDEAIRHLGTIAKSGTREFVAGLEEAKRSDVAGLIGQFGVGFYSAFMVADRVVVESRAARLSSDEGVRWESTGDGRFTTERIARARRGTTVTLHLKDDAGEFAERFRLQGLIKKYSDYVGYPVFLPKADAADELEQANAGKALWTRPKAEITDEQYTEFYHAACRQWDEPATWLHVAVEGVLAFTALLYIPSQRPIDLFDRGRRGLSLYVRRVFIMDDCDELLPEWLRFVRGVVDSDDLPLNVSREMLQEHAVVAKLRKQLVKRVLDHLEKLAKSDDAEERKTFLRIDEQFGPVLREGIVADPEQKERLVRLARWRSTWTETQEGDAAAATSLADYVARMAEGQDRIYYVTAPSLAAAKASPHLEGFRRTGYEVLFLSDPVDEWVVQHLHEHDGKQLVSVAKGAAELGNEEERKALAEQEERYRDFLGFCKEALGDEVREVRLTPRLTDSPCCLVADEHGLSSNFEELLRRFGQDVPKQARILELNPEHELVRRLQALHAGGAHDELGEWVRVLRDQALLAEGARIDDPAAFARRVQRLMAAAARD